MKSRKGIIVTALAPDAPEYEYVERTLAECREQIPKAVAAAREDRSQASLARVCDLSRSLWFVFDAQPDPSLLRNEVTRLLEECAAVSSEVNPELAGRERELAEHYLEKNEQRLRWARTTEQADVLADKWAVLRAIGVAI